MDGPPVTPDPPAGATAVAELLGRIAAADYRQVPVVNAVAAPPAAPDHRSGSRARRRAARAARRRRRHPEKYRVEFTDWVAIPWRDRPIEARLADFARATGQAVQRSAAWRHPLLESHRLWLDPEREAAEIAIGAYRIYGVRCDLDAPLRRPGQPAGAAAGPDGAAPAGYREKRAALDDAWLALVRRLAALDAYRQHLAEIAPELAAVDAAAYLDGAPIGELMAQVTTAGAGDELATSDTERLAAEAGALAQVLIRARQRQDPAGARLVPVAPPEVASAPREELPPGQAAPASTDPSEE